MSDCLHVCIITLYWHIQCDSVGFCELIMAALIMHAVVCRFDVGGVSQ